jgi:hypothetical protein
MSRARPDADRPLIRRDADGVERTAPSLETLTERMIREAQEAGAFDDLPHRGTPLPLDDETHAGEMAMAFHILRNAGAAPPWIETDKEARRLEAEIESLVNDGPDLRGLGRRRSRDALVARIREHATVVARLAVLAPTPRQQRRPLDQARLLARFDGEPHDPAGA